jgi:hypothetical protein
MKISKAQSQQLATFRSRLASTKGNVSRLYDDLLAAIKAAESKLGTAIDEHNAVVGEAEEFVTGIADGFDDDFGEKSERWQEGDAGQAARSFIDEWQNINLSEVDRVRVLRPDEPDFGDIELELPEESES